MHGDNIERLRQAFPRLYTATRFECDDKWFSQLMALGARLEAVLRDDEGEAAGLQEDFVETVLETSDGLDVSLYEENPLLTGIIDGFKSQFHDVQRGETHEDPYYRTHNIVEQTTSEEAVRADRSQWNGRDTTPPASLR